LGRLRLQQEQPATGQPEVGGHVFLWLDRLLLRLVLIPKIRMVQMLGTVQPKRCTVFQ